MGTGSPNSDLVRMFGLFSEQLTDFIALSDSILKGSGSFLSLFRRVPFDRFEADSRTMADHWVGLVLNADAELRTRFYAQLAPQEKDCFEHLIRWASAVRDAAMILADNQAAFAARARNTRTLTLIETRERDQRFT